MLTAVGDDTAPAHLRTFLEIAAGECRWGEADFKQLEAGTLPAGSPDAAAMKNIAVIMRGFPRLHEELTEVMKRFGAERLASRDGLDSAKS